MKEQEQLLIEGLKVGEEKAYHDLFFLHYSALCSLAMQIVNDTFLAESLVSDTITHIWEIRQSLEIKSSLRAYLMSAVRNRCYNYLALECENREINFPEYCDSYEACDSSVKSSNNPLSILLEKELENEIRHSIGRLDESCKRVFLKSRFENKKNEEIARELGISVNTVKYHIKNALAALRKDLGRYLILPMPVILHLIEKNLQI